MFEVREEKTFFYSCKIGLANFEPSWNKKFSLYKNEDFDHS